MFKIALIILLFLTNQRFTKAQYLFKMDTLSFYAQKDISGPKTDFAKIEQLIENLGHIAKAV